MADKRFSGLRAMGRQMKIYARMDLMWLLRDTRVFVVCVFTDVVLALAAISGLYLLAQSFGGLGGLSNHEMLLMLGYGLCVDGLCSVFFGGANASAPSRRFGRGQIDHMMMQPVPIWVQIVTDGFSPISGGAMLVTGAIFTAVAIRLSGISVSVWWAAMLLTQMFSSLGVMLGFLYLTAVPAFYAQVAAEEVSTTVNGFFSSLKQFPLGAMPAWARIIFSTALPVGLAAWLPTAALVGRASPFAMLITPIVAVIHIAAAVYFVSKGLKHYATVGAQRYSNRGFRG